MASSADPGGHAVCGHLNAGIAGSNTVPIPVVEGSTADICGSSLAEIAGLHPDGACMCVWCVVQ